MVVRGEWVAIFIAAAAVCAAGVRGAGAEGVVLVMVRAIRASCRTIVGGLVACGAGLWAAG